MTRLRGLPPRRLDVLLAGLVLVPAEIEAALIADGGERLPAMALVAVMAGSLALRRAAPMAGLLMLFASAVPMTHLVDESDSFASPILLVLIWGYTIGSLPDLRAALRGLALIGAGIAAVSASFASVTFGDFVFPIGFATAAWGAGRALRHRARLAAELHEAAVRSEDEREAQAAQAVADERRRIAREMHDVVAHSVAVMVVQAGGARRILDRDPARAVDAAALVERTGRSALLEMRRLLGVLGSGDEPAATAPQPTLGELDALVARVRDAGLPVEMRTEGEPHRLPAGAEAAVYRVVQEALTNVLKHAGAAATEVVLRWSEDALEMSVADHGRSHGTAEGPGLPGSEHGIVGMRERVRVYGGELTALPRSGGGFVVRARIPYEQAELVA